MKLYRGHLEIHENFPKPVLTIGNFDGLHLKHRKLIQSMTERARVEGGTSIIYTFRPHPHHALSPGSAMQLLNTYDEKLEMIEAMGVDVAIEEPFSREFSTIAPEKFLRDILLKRLSALAVYVGYDFAFGKDRAGSLELLKEFCEAEGVECNVCVPLKIGGEICSSTSIREHILAGRIREANALLGREFFYRGLVVRGHGRGKKIGFATANVHTESLLSVKEGVYVTRAAIKGSADAKTYASVTNVGRQPTFNKDAQAPVVMETHILDFDLDIYGETLEVRMVDRLRDEVRFSSVDQLVAQIRTDITKAKRWLLTNGKAPRQTS